MARDNGAKTGDSRIDIQLREIVKDVDLVGANLDDVRGRKAGSPCTLVVIAADRPNRSKVPERSQHGWATDVATMNNDI
jgi:hypothetical protein